MSHIGFIRVGAEHLEAASRSTDNVSISVRGLSEHQKIPAFKNIIYDAGVYALISEQMETYADFAEFRKRPAVSFDGMLDLLEKYQRFVKKHLRDKNAFGFIEPDVGDYADRLSRRADLEKQGLPVIPIFHPLEEDSGAFDLLLDNYNTVAVGDLTGSSMQTRASFMGYIHKRRRETGRWIHLLSAPPSELLMAFPVDSFDSTSWMSAVKWDGHTPRVAMKRFGRLDRTFHYAVGDGKQWSLGVAMGACGAALQYATWKDAMEKLDV